MPSAVSQKSHQSSDSTSVSHSDSIPTHPLGVKPLGNQYLAKGPNARRSTGSWTCLPDEILALVLEGFDKQSLLNLGSACKFLYAFCHSEELWKALYLR